MLTTHPLIVPRLRMSRSYTSFPPKRSTACSGTNLLYSFEEIVLRMIINPMNRLAIEDTGKCLK
jgi:hypothetical protein